MHNVVLKHFKNLYSSLQFGPPDLETLKNIKAHKHPILWNAINLLLADQKSFLDHKEG